MTEEEPEYITINDLPKETFVHSDGTVSVVYKGTGEMKCQDATIASMKHYIQINASTFEITSKMTETIKKLKDD